MNHLKLFEQLCDISDLEDCLQEIFDMFHIINKKLSGPIVRDPSKISKYNRNYNFYYYIEKSKAGSEIDYNSKNPIHGVASRQGIIIGFDRNNLIPVKKEILNKKQMIQKRLRREIVIDTPPNPDYLFIYYK